MISPSSFGRMAACFLMLVCARGAAAQEPCELHFWATADAMAASNIFLNPALQRGVTTGNAVLDVLPAQAQADAIERLDLAGLLGMPGVRLIRETSSLSDGDAAHRRTRATASTASCYAELEVKRIGYRADPFFGRAMAGVFIFRRFPAGGGPAEIIQGHGDVRVHIFPAREESQRDAARDEMVAAFGTSFSMFAREKLNRPAPR
jgi:hypothetical protein